MDSFAPILVRAFATFIKTFFTGNKNGNETHSQRQMGEIYCFLLSLPPKSLQRLKQSKRDGPPALLRTRFFFSHKKASELAISSRRFLPCRTRPRSLYCLLCAEGVRERIIWGEEEKNSLLIVFGKTSQLLGTRVVVKNRESRLVGYYVGVGHDGHTYWVLFSESINYFQRQNVKTSDGHIYVPYTLCFIVHAPLTPN